MLKLLKNPHTHQWEYVSCKDGETLWKCKVKDCKATKLECHDSGCGG